LLANGRWFSSGTPASSTTKAGRHDIAEILLKVALKHQKSNQIPVFCILYLLLKGGNFGEGEITIVVPLTLKNKYRPL
jgi:hypothetical protein